MTPHTAPTSPTLRQAWRTTTTAGKIALLAGVVAITLLLVPMYKLAEAALLPTPGEFTTSKEDDSRAKQYAAAFGGYVGQLNGRSLFWTPSKPGTDATVVVEEEATDGDSTTAATKYDGPAITAIVLDSVWFADGKRLSVTDAEENSIKVVSTNAPWDAVIRYRGTEFTVPFFERDKVIFKDKAPSSNTTGNTTSDSVNTTPSAASPAANPTDSPTTDTTTIPATTPVTPPTATKE